MWKTLGIITAGVVVVAGAGYAVSRITGKGIKVEHPMLVMPKFSVYEVEKAKKDDKKPELFTVSREAAPEAAPEAAC